MLGGVLHDGEKVLSIEPGSEVKIQTGKGNTYRAKTVILTPGDDSVLIMGSLSFQTEMLDQILQNTRGNPCYLPSPVPLPAPTPSLSAASSPYSPTPKQFLPENEQKQTVVHLPRSSKILSTCSALVTGICCLLVILVEYWGISSFTMPFLHGGDR